MSVFHRRWERETSLLAAGVLEGPSRDAAERHAGSCARCAADLAALRAVLAAAASDEACAAEPPVAVEWLHARVIARLDGAGAVARRPVRTVWAAGLLSAAAVAAAVSALRPPAISPPAAAPAVVDEGSEPRIAVSDEALDRMERTMARERTVRYLDEAQDVLVTVSGAPQRCRREAQQVDVAEESRRSRELLARRSRLDLDRSAALAAGPVLDDVERMLREVASLEDCARRRDVEAIHRELERERLLMKIDLMARELAG